MDSMRIYGDSPTGYESGAIKHSELLSDPVVESTIFGVTLQWNAQYIGEFVKVANSNHIETELPSWVTQPRGQITAHGFKSDVMAVLLDVAGGLARENDLAPNTMMQSYAVIHRLGQIEMEPFVQACMVELEHGAFFAAVFVRYECPGFGIMPAHFPGPLRPHRKIFY